MKVSHNLNFKSLSMKINYLPTSLMAKIIVIINSTILCFAFSLSAQVEKSAFLVLGQPDFNSGSVNQGGAVGANTFQKPAQILIVNGKFIVADAENNRVLIFNSIPVSNNASADVVIGQFDFTHNIVDHGGDTAADALDRPSGLATDGQRLFVLDRDNYRVLIYNSIPTENGTSADMVIGQKNMTDRIHGGESVFNDTTNLGPYHLSTGATGLHYDEDSGKLIVYDSDNDRVMIYNRIPDSNGVAADVVIGQPDFFHNMTNQGGEVGPNTLDLSTCAGVATHNGKLFIADRRNNRVLIYNSIPTTNNAPADVVIGQIDFTHNSPNQGGAISANGFNNSRYTAFDSFGRLYIPDLNARILVYNQIPEVNGAAADYVIGQPDFSTGNPSTTDSTFSFIYHLLIHNDTLIVSDPGNHRILFFNIEPPTITGVENRPREPLYLSLYPNPAATTINIPFPNTEKIKIIRIFSSTGNVFYPLPANKFNNQLTIDINSLSSGYYFLSIQTHNQIYVAKFMKI